MKITVLGAYGGELGSHRGSAYLFENGVLLDAGGASGAMTLDEVRSLKAIVLTHAHADHISSIPFLLDVRIGYEALPIYALRETIAALRIHVFNNRIWPDFERIPDHRNPLLRYVEIEREKEFELHGVRFLPVGVDHTVPTVGFIISNEGGSIVFSGDTGPTRRIWELARSTEDLRAALVELSFPARLDRISTLSKHFSTLSIRGELEKIAPEIPVIIYHLKPAFIDEIKAELEPIAAERGNLSLIEQGKTYEF